MLLNEISPGSACVIDSLDEFGLSASTIVVDNSFSAAMEPDSKLAFFFHEPDGLGLAQT
jgi:hypothetical protein